MIKDHPREVSKVTSEDAQSALYELLTTRYGILQQGASSSAGPAVSSPGGSSDGPGGSATGAQVRVLLQATCCWSSNGPVSCEGVRLFVFACVFYGGVPRVEKHLLLWRGRGNGTERCTRSELSV